MQIECNYINLHMGATMSKNKLNNEVTQLAKKFNVTEQEITDIAIWKFVNTSEQNQEAIIQLYNEKK